MTIANIVENEVAAETQASDLQPVTFSEQFFVFKIGAEQYCINLKHVLEIKGFLSVNKTSNAANNLKGFLEVRGSLAPVFDLKEKFGMGETAQTRNTIVIALNLHNSVVGVLADEGCEIIAANAAQITHIPENETVNYVSGLIKNGDVMAIYIDIEKAITAKSIASAKEQAINLAA